MTLLRFLIASLTTIGCTSAANQHPAGTLPPIELQDEASAARDSSPAQNEPGDSETRRSTLPEIKPCSEANPGGCRAPNMEKRAKLDPAKRYVVDVRGDDPSEGPVTAPVTVVVFSDYQCPFCSQLEPVLKDLRTRFGDQLRLVWKDLPLSIHPFAVPTALLAREAYVRYGAERFWHVHDELFLHQSTFGEAWLATFAKAEGLTWPADERYLARVEQSVQQADQLSIGATPTVFVNGRPVIGAEHVSVYADLVNEELSETPSR